MPENNGSRIKTTAEIDPRALEIEIDREIDSLFVPSQQRQSPFTGTGTVELKSVPETGAPDPAQNSAGLDFDAVQDAIDSEIDSLFVPARQRQTQLPGTAAVELQSVPGTGAPDSSQNSAGLDFDAVQAEIDREIDNLFVPLSEKKDGREQALKSPGLPVAGTGEKTVHTGFQKGVDDSAGTSTKAGSAGESEAFLLSGRDEPNGTSRIDELPKLVECFNAAYLSLDWEFSREHIGKLLSALKELAPFATISIYTAPIFKVLKVVLERLYLRPQAANRRIVDLIRESQALLAHTLLMDGEPGAPEKERVRAIVRSFREMREKAIASKVEAGKTPSVERPEDKAPVPSPPPEPIPSSAPMEELRSWLETTCRFMSESLGEFDAQIRRIRQIEVILGKAPALSPVADRLMKIRNALDHQSAMLKEKESEWRDRAALIDKFGVLRAEHRTDVGSQAPFSSFLPPPISDFRTDICLFSRAEESFALPAENVVKIEPVSARTAARIFSRGYAALADFKPLFRGIKSGVLDQWAKIPAREIRSYKFEPVNSELFRQVEEFPCTAVLVSDGHRHRIIFANRAELVQEASIDTGTSPDGLLGVFSTGDGRQVALHAFDDLFNQWFIAEMTKQQ